MKGDPFNMDNAHTRILSLTRQLEWANARISALEAQKQPEAARVHPSSPLEYSDLGYTFTLDGDSITVTQQVCDKEYLVSTFKWDGSRIVNEHGEPVLLPTPAQAAAENYFMIETVQVPVESVRPLLKALGQAVWQQYPAIGPLAVAAAQEVADALVGPETVIGPETMASDDEDEPDDAITPLTEGQTIEVRRTINELLTKQGWDQRAIAQEIGHELRLHGFVVSIGESKNDEEGIPGVLSAAELKLVRDLVAKGKAQVMKDEREIKPDTLAGVKDLEKRGFVRITRGLCMGFFCGDKLLDTTSAAKAVLMMHDKFINGSLPHDSD